MADPDENEGLDDADITAGGLQLHRMEKVFVALVGLIAAAAIAMALWDFIGL
jgi:hypothetical protein